MWVFQMIGELFMSSVALILIFWGVLLCKMFLQYGNKNKYDYIAPISMFVVGVGMLYFIYFVHLNISISMRCYYELCRRFY